MWHRALPRLPCLLQSPKPFQRVNAEEWLDKKGAWDNRYEATFGQGGWGFKAQQVLGAVRGK